MIRCLRGSPGATIQQTVQFAGNFRYLQSYRRAPISIIANGHISKASRWGVTGSPVRSSPDKSPSMLQKHTKYGIKAPIFVRTYHHKMSELLYYNRHYCKLAVVRESFVVPGH